MFRYAAKCSLLVGLLSNGVYGWGDPGCDEGWFASSLSGHHPHKCCEKIGCGIYQEWARDRRQCDYKNCEQGCHNEDGRRRLNDWCYCSSAYKLVHGRECHDRDECHERSHDCSNNGYTKCHNLHANDGRFKCECERDDGFYMSSRTECLNVNECDKGKGNDGCSIYAECDDETPTSSNGYKKVTCKCEDGYRDYGSVPGTDCREINECTERIHSCDTNATCNNAIGGIPGYTCECNTGYTGNGYSCTDINECDSTPCHENADCTNIDGSYHCDCVEGHFGEGHDCTVCHELSTWSEEGYDVTAMAAVCPCNTGYEGDGSVCTDIDECDRGTDTCDPNATCTNTDGWYICKCNPGYFGYGEECTTCDDETNFDTMMVSCHPTDGISLTAPYCAFWNVEIVEQNFLAAGENCVIENTGVNIEMSLPTSSECGTEVVNNGTFIIYSNAVIGEIRARDGTITRKKTLELDFECAFEADQQVSFDHQISEMIDHVDITLDQQDKKFDVTMGIFTDSTFTEIVPDDYTITVPDMINAGVSLKNGEDALVVMNKKCWGTPTADPDDEDQYVFIDNFCSTNTNVMTMVKNGQDKHAQFELESFEFVDRDDGILYLHCHAVVCDTEIETCEVDCSSVVGSRRRRRSSTERTAAALRVGPIRIISPNY